MKRLFLLLALGVALPAQGRVEDTTKILDCMRANVPPSVRVQDIELETTDRAGGTRTLKGKVYSQLEKTPAGGGLIRAMLRINAPATFAGAAYLVRETENYLNEGMYVYLPSVNRVRRVSGTFADGAMLGTNFSYNDFKQLQNAFVGSRVSLELGAKIEDRRVNVVVFEAIAAPKQPPPRYSKVRTWVDDKTCVPLKVDFYEGETVRKQLTAPASALQKSANYWYLSEVEMRDLVQGSKTTLRVLGLTASKELPGTYFNPQLFYLNR
jgi:hypothetical protein